MVAFLKSGAGTMLNTTFSAAVSIVSGVSSFLIGFIFAIYILLQKETLGRQIKKVLEAFLPEPAVGRILDITALTERTFSHFLTGQCAEDSGVERSVGRLCGDVGQGWKKERQSVKIHLP